MLCPQCKTEMHEVDGSSELNGIPPTFNCTECGMCGAIESGDQMGRILFKGDKEGE